MAARLLRDSFAKVAKRLNITDWNDVFEYVCGMENEQDLNEYLSGLLDDSSQANQTVIEEFISLWRTAPRHMNFQNLPSTPATIKETNEGRRPKKTGKSHGSPSSQQSPSPAKSDVATDSIKAEESPPMATLGNSRGRPAKSAHKVHYSPLFSEEGQDKLVIKLPGRHRCECQAVKHQLINNCLNCGRIVCSQEGSGPCYSCGNLVCTNKEQEVIDVDSKQSRQLLKKLSSSKVKDIVAKEAVEDASLKKAIEHKDRLLEFDRTVKRRTKVIDDQSDFFGVENVWLSGEERQALAKKEQDMQQRRKNASKATKITFDFAGRQIIEEKENYHDDFVDEELLLLSASKKGSDPRESDLLRPQSASGDPLPRSVYCPSGLEPDRSRRKSGDSLIKTKMRLQDDDIQTMSDEGRCLSVHQPYASLLVTGLKRHEGRSWYTALRGRLWIASTARKPNPQEIRDEENTIRAIKEGHKLKFPKSYPVGALLGCVNVVDCLPQEDYLERFKESESTAPYVFICEDPQILAVQFPIKGQCKIYKLDPDIHRVAKMHLKELTVTSK